MHTTVVKDRLLRDRFLEFKARGLDLDLTRGKPCPDQLSLSWAMLGITSTHSESGVDCWNYGHLEGLPEARVLFGEYLGVPAENTFILGNSSLAVMHDLVVQAMLRALPGGFAWGSARTFGALPAMLCPVPGYDRHHNICERYGIRMIPVPMNENGPDMEAVQELAQQPFVVGIWCTPKYSNPTGITYSREVCECLARMRADETFRIFWDCAYHMHDLKEKSDELPNMLDLCREAGHEDRVFVIGSTSKMTFPGGGIAFLAASKRNLAWYRESLSVQTIGADKLNQLRHVKFLRNLDGIRAHMARHRHYLKPKFDVVQDVLEWELRGKGVAEWSVPRGGYFVSFNTRKGCAKKVVALAGDLGVKFTPAGAAFPYHNDPEDSHIRIAPTFPPIEEVRVAAEVLALCTRIVSAE